MRLLFPHGYSNTKPSIRIRLSGRTPRSGEHDLPKVLPWVGDPRNVWRRGDGLRDLEALLRRGSGASCPDWAFSLGSRSKSLARINPRNSLYISELRATRRPCPVTHWLAVSYGVFLRPDESRQVKPFIALFGLKYPDLRYLSQNMLSCILK